MTVHYNYPDKFIEEPKYFSSVVAESYVNTRARTPKQVSPISEIQKWI